ncbi:MAG: hypothetical protein ACRDT6_27365, partial [Micromonosporaceae bacterium]
MKVGEYLENWLAGKHALKPKTVALYRDALDLYLAPHLGSIGLLELRPNHLDRFYSAIAIGKRGKPLSASSIRRIHAALRSALNTAVKRRLIPYGPALHVELAPENPHRPKPWTAEQCQLFLRTCLRRGYAAVVVGCQALRAGVGSSRLAISPIIAHLMMASE